MATLLNVDELKIDGGTQSRTEIDDAVVSEYADALKNDAAFPAVTAYFDGVSYWLADGFHRWHAHRAAGISSIYVDVKNGSKRDAVLYSVGANATHGLRRTNADKRKSVDTLLNDSEWGKWSDREIARACGVNHELVGKMRKELSGGNRQIDAIRTVERKGKVYQQNTANIGKKPSGNVIDRIEAQANAGAAAVAADLGVDDFGPSETEIAEALAAEAEQKRIAQEQADMLLKAAESDNQLAALIEENNRLIAVNAGLQSRLNGLMGEKDAAVRQVQFWKKQAEKLGYVYAK